MHRAADPHAALQRVPCMGDSASRVSRIKANGDVYFFADERSWSSRENFHYLLIGLFVGTAVLSVIALWPRNTSMKSEIKTF
jgi:hypothetical protein